MKITKISNKGFMIAELLIVTVAIMVIFTAIYVNFYPTMGEYEKRQEFNNINATYANYYLKHLYLVGNGSIKLSGTLSDPIVLIDNGVCQFDLFHLNSYCQLLVDNFEIEDAIITNYSIEDIKESYTGVLKEYIDYLPTYRNATIEQSELFRIITKTHDGYATDQLYSRACIETIKVGGSCDIDINVCNGDTSEENCKREISKYNASNSYADWQTEHTCTPNNNVCELVTSGGTYCIMEYYVSSANAYVDDLSECPVGEECEVFYKIYEFCDDNSSDPGCVDIETYQKIDEVQNTIDYNSNYASECQ